MNIPGIKGKNEKHYLLCFAEGKLCFQNLGMQHILNGVLKNLQGKFHCFYLCSNFLALSVFSGKFRNLYCCEVGDK